MFVLITPFKHLSKNVYTEVILHVLPTNNLHKLLCN